MGEGFIQGPDRNLNLFDKLKTGIGQSNYDGLSIGLTQFVSKEVVEVFRRVQWLFGELIEAAKAVSRKAAINRMAFALLITAES